MAIGVQRGATEEGARQADARPVCQTTGEEIDYGIRRLVGTSGTQKEGDAGSSAFLLNGLHFSICTIEALPFAIDELGLHIGKFGVHNRYAKS